MSEQKTTPKAPAGLQAAGKRLWRSVHAAVPAVFELDERDLSVLELACRQADVNVLLEQALAASGPVVLGSQGQPVLSGVVGELRQGRIAVARLLHQIELGEEQRPRSEASRRGKRAADARWQAHRELVARREALRRGA